MSRWYKQRNLTISDEQREFIQHNDGKVDVGTLAVMLGLSYNKVQHNRRVLGLVKQRAKVIKMVTVNDDELFDLEEFAKAYRF